MKKLQSFLALTMLFSTLANADFTRVEMGAGAWSNEAKGLLTYRDGASIGNYTSDEKSNTSGYVWLMVKHPLPVLPNLRLEYTSVEDAGAVNGSFEDFTVAGVANADIKMNQYDAVLYYNILDNTAWITLDVGLDVKFIDLDFRANGNLLVNGTPQGSYSVNETLPLPMGYVRARVQIPSTDIGLEADAKYVTYDGSSVSDYRVKVDYTFDFVPLVQPAVELGYRAQKFDLTYDNDKTKLELDFSGFYAGVMLRF